VWSVDLSSLTPTVPHTTSIVEGAYSNNAGATWHSLGQVAAPLTDPLTINSSPPTAYTQVTNPSIGFDGQDNVSILSLQTSGAGDGALVVNRFGFSGPTPVAGSTNVVYQWVTGSDAATTHMLAVDAAPSNTTGPDPYANNVYIAWTSIDVEP